MKLSALIVLGLFSALSVADEQTFPVREGNKVVFKKPFTFGTSRGVSTERPEADATEKVEPANGFENVIARCQFSNDKDIALQVNSVEDLESALENAKQGLKLTVATVHHA